MVKVQKEVVCRISHAAKGYSKSCLPADKRCLLPPDCVDHVHKTTMTAPTGRHAKMFPGLKVAAALDWLGGAVAWLGGAPEEQPVKKN